MLRLSMKTKKERKKERKKKANLSQTKGNLGTCAT